MADTNFRRQRRPSRRNPRKHVPSAERQLWERLRGEKLSGLEFRRQFVLGPFVLDFYCPEAHLAVELDAESHFNGDPAEREELRRKWIEAAGIKTLRIMSADVLKTIDGVLGEIAKAAGPAPTKAPKAKDPARRLRSEKGSR